MPVVAPSPVLRAHDLHDYQRHTLHQLMRAVRNCHGETFTVMFPRQAGKNEVSAALVAQLLHENLAGGGHVIVCAPTFSPQTQISFDRTRQLLAPAGTVAPARFAGATISVGRASATYLSASPDAHVAGHTASLALIADEAQDIDADWFNRQFRPMAASTGAVTIMFGTPWTGDTLLEQTVAANRRIDAFKAAHFTSPIPRHQQVDWQTVAAANARYGHYVRSERERLGAQHPIFLTQYELLPADGAGHLLSRDTVDALRGDFPRLRTPRHGDRYVAGCDFGGEGPDADRTVVTIARLLAGGRLEVVEHIAWRGARFSTVIAGVAELLHAWEIERMCADATGMGGPLVSRLRDLAGARVESFVFSDSSKSQLGYDLVAAINTGRLAVYADDASAESRTFTDELRACRSWLRGHSLLRWEAPPGAHDDYVASLALCWRAAATAPPPRVAAGRRRHR